RGDAARGAQARFLPCEARKAGGEPIGFGGALSVGNRVSRLVSRVRNSQALAARSRANFGIGALSCELRNLRDASGDVFIPCADRWPRWRPPPAPYCGAPIPPRHQPACARK